MNDSNRREEARKRAEDYAPRPVSSALMYGFVGVCLAGLGWAAFSRFYDLDPFGRPLWMGFVFLLVFAGSIALRFVRKRRHSRAYHQEYDKRQE